MTIAAVGYIVIHTSKANDQFESELHEMQKSLAIRKADFERRSKINNKPKT